MGSRLGVGFLCLVVSACGDDSQPGSESSGGSSDSGGTTAMTMSDTGGSTAPMDGSSSGDDTDGTTSGGSSSDGADSTDGGDSSSDDGSSGSSTGGNNVDPLDACGTPITPVTCTDPTSASYPGSMHDLDIIFVVDNSGSMGVPQARLGAAMDAFAARLDNEGIDYRIAVTTTDNGNPWCSGTTPEGGSFVATSCRQRQADFVFNGGVVVDVTDEACLDICPHDSIAIQPTTTAVDASLMARPWIERIGGTTNLPGGVTPAEALRCFLPQGINGCGFEQPLESLNKALLRAGTNGEEEYGFIRSGADTLLVVVSDEVDCSHDQAFEEIFLPSGNKVFWSDPTAPAPTSAVCWNAGVECVGSSPYDGCASQNWDVDGNGGVSDSEAVLRPMSRYETMISDLDSANGGGDVRVALIGGVPDAGGELVYADSDDPVAQDAWGIGFGCDSGTVTGLPPVRVRELFQNANPATDCPLYSICSDDYCDEFETMIDSVLP